MVPSTRPKPIIPALAASPEEQDKDQPMTAREITDALIADKAPQATRKQAIDLQAAS